MAAQFILREALKKKRVTVYQLAKRLGIRYEHAFRLCRVKNPTLKTMNRLAAAIGCRVRDLIKE